MIEKLKGTIHELLDSKKFVVWAISVLTSALTALLAFVFAWLSPKLGLPDSLAEKIPQAAAWLVLGIVGSASAYCHSQGLADAGKEAAQIAADAAPKVGSSEFKVLVQSLAIETVKAAVDNHVPQAIAAALTSKPAVPIADPIATAPTG